MSADPKTLLYEIARTLLSDRDYGELLAAILDAAIEGLGADRGFVIVREGSGFSAAVARNYKSKDLQEAEREVSGTIASAVLEEGHAMVIGDALDSQRFGSSDSVKRMSMRSVLAAPLVASQEAFALLCLEHRDVVERFTDDDRTLLEEICALAGPRLRAAVELAKARQRLNAPADEPFITADESMHALLDTLRKTAATDLPILLEGETGTGKELLARAVYRHSTRSQGPFVAVNCGAIPANLIESELFGYTRGAFTGANRDRTGLIGSAHRGTLFLDEIGEMPLELQSRLLRVLQSGELLRVGATRPETVDIRIVAATNRDLAEEVEAGRFRADLFYRLSTVTLRIPPLRERPHDLHLLVAHFLRTYAARFGRESPRLSRDTMSVLEAWSFPGNVRELEGEMARIVALATPGVEVPADALNPRIRKVARREASAGVPATAVPAIVAPMSLAAMEKQLIASVLEETGGNRTRAADILGISREGLRTKMQRHALSTRESAETD